MLTVSRRGADELRQLLLREVVVHPQAVALLGAEALGQAEQRLGDAAGHVGEDEVGQRVVRAPQPAGQHAQQLLGDLGPVADPRPQRGVRERGQPGVGEDRGGGGARTGVEQRQLAEHVATGP